MSFLKEAQPNVSIIIPAYNQAHFLAAAVDSALAQTYRNYEIIVVDDGSTDDTPAVAAQYGDCIRYIRQENRGLAGARNTGITAARGTLIGLLDSDDIWLPKYLETITGLAERYPHAAVYYSRARCMDVDGRDLPQIAGYRDIEPGALYHTLLRANHLIPSTVTIRTAAVRQANLFDPQFRSCEDWDLWLKLSREQQAFIGTRDVLVRYRIHGSSLSANTQYMQHSKRMVIEKHFGQDDGQYGTWTDDKRRAYGGVYRYVLQTDVQRRNHWSAEPLRQALLADPSIAGDVPFFYELALGSQPIGKRGTSEQLTLTENAARLHAILAEVFKPGADSAVQSMRSRVYSTAYKALGLAAYNLERYALSRKYLLAAVRYHPRYMLDKLVAGNLIKTFLPKRTLSLVRKLRERGAALKSPLRTL